MCDETCGKTDSVHVAYSQLVNYFDLIYQIMWYFLHQPIIYIGLNLSQHIASWLRLNTLPDDRETYNLTYVYNKLLEKNRICWQLLENIKPKLRAFVNIHDYSSTQTLVRSNITRFQRSLVARIKMGILPLKYETDRYQESHQRNAGVKFVQIMFQKMRPTFCSIVWH